MMRNKEIRQAVLWFLSMTLILTTTGYTISPLSGVLVFVMAGLSGTLFFVITRKRYRRIARLSEQIDRVLHNDERLKIGEAEEGELSILHSEIVKMTLRIREQNEALRNEKEHLADSLADVAHQLRTPLTSVNIILSLVEKDTDQKNQKALLREAGALLEQTDFLLTSLLKLSRLDAKIVVFQKEQIKVKDLLSAALRPLFVSMDLHDIRVRTDIPEEAAVSGDLKWLAEAFRNIIKNSIESVGDNGQIEITCENNPLFTEIIIHDDGAGFSEEDLPYLFERFYQGKYKEEDSENAGRITGYGIGLALCRTIIMEQGGTISAKNHPQGGAVFQIRFMHFPTDIKK